MMNILQYTDAVHKELESFHYPELIRGYNEYQVALSMGKTIAGFYLDGLSYRMCAIVIWSLTMVHQIIPQAAQQVKH